MGVSVSPLSLPATVKQIKIHSSTTVIPERFFAKCVHLEEIELPELIEEIRDGAFEYCSSLRMVTGAYVSIPPKVKTIPYRCFYGCSNLKSVFIPGSVVDIKSYAFAECSSLSGVIYQGNTELNDTTVFSSNPTVDVEWSYPSSKLCGINVSHELPSPSPLTTRNQRQVEEDTKSS